MRRWVGVGVCGALGGAACDQIHVRSGMLAYPHRWFLGQAWWVAPQFGIAVLVMVLAAVPLARQAGGLVAWPTPPVVAIEAAWFLGAYAATGVWGRSRPGVLATVLVGIWAARLARRPDRWPLAALSLLLAIGGVAYEGSLAATGAFHYVRPALYHIPVWLPGLYLQGAPLLVSATRLLDQRRVAAPVSG